MKIKTRRKAMKAIRSPLILNTKGWEEGAWHASAAAESVGTVKGGGKNTYRKWIYI
jgi:hypothetical protein